MMADLGVNISHKPFVSEKGSRTALEFGSSAGNIINYLHVNNHRDGN